MSRDRLAERRAQQGGRNQSAQQDVQHNSYELDNRRRNPFDQRDDSPYDQRNGRYGDEKDYTSSDNLTGGFLQAIDSVKTEIEAYEALVNAIASLHSQSISVVDEQSSDVIKDKLESSTQEATELSQAIKQKINTLKSWKGPDKNPQLVAVTSKKFVAAIQRYQDVERESRNKHKQRMERQARIVRPGATDEQIQAIVESDDQVFAQELKSSNRLGSATSAYREVQKRHEDVKRIEQTIIELAELFNEMNFLIAQQDEVIQQIETQAYEIHDEVEKGVVQTGTAVEHARRARKLRKWCLLLTVVIIIIIAIAVLATILPKINAKNDDNNKN